MKINSKITHNFFYFFWGTASSFALITDNPSAVQMLAPVPILFFWMNSNGSKMLTILSSRPIGILIFFSSVIVGVSAIINGFTVNGLIRYLALVPVFAVLLMTCEDKEYLDGALRSFAASSFLFVVVHLGLADFAEIFNPQYRLGSFMNTNGVGFIACICALVHIVLFSQKRKQDSKIFIYFDLFAVVAGIAVLFLTRSRTATLAFIGGVACLPFAVPELVSKKMGRLLFLGAGAVILTVCYWPAIFEFVSYNYSFFDKYRSIETATNRTEIWSYTFYHIIMNNLFIGIGPGMHLETIENATGYTNANNGLLVYMAEIGLLGTIPYILLLVFTFVKTLESKGLRRFFLVILVAGFIESLGETIFFSTGSVASLIFLLAIAAENNGGVLLDEKNPFSRNEGIRLISTKRLLEKNNVRSNPWKS